jgi:hypothetical protein
LNDPHNKEEMELLDLIEIGERVKGISFFFELAGIFGGIGSVASVGECWGSVGNVDLIKKKGMDIISLSQGNFFFYKSIGESNTQKELVLLQKVDSFRNSTLNPRP